ncbi:DUF1218 domain-containing protein [Weissella cibaria]|nr:DUF1218 domain-containing protein [Weissella cibaria]MCS8566269.1 DUF1218 domain-containing protein [Weissella cibaria]MCS8576078.1 DUF1218 domain-containing protein [Weissella cibaria]MCT0954579.1 DUF1218 domain-containing protein [Weissella cibaria]
MCSPCSRRNDAKVRPKTTIVCASFSLLLTLLAVAFTAIGQVRNRSGTLECNSCWWISS